MIGSSVLRLKIGVSISEEYGNTTRVSLTDAVFVESAEDVAGKLTSIGDIDREKQIFCGDLFSLIDAHFNALVTKGPVDIVGNYNGTTTSTLINKPNTNNDNNTPIKATRINWAKSPHRERLAIILNDCFSQTGLAIDDEQNPTGKPITDYKQYAAKVGISRTTLFKYIHKDPSKRRLVKEEGESAGRGKKRLIDEGGVRFIVSELKAKADV